MRLPILVFNIETTLDLTMGAHLHGLSHLPKEDVQQALNKLRRQETGSDFQRLHLHEISCISGLWVSEKGLRLFSFSQNEYTELEILEKFLSIFEKRLPILVSWNGAQFDLPVILLRAMYYGLSAPRLFDQGEIDQQKRFNNYQNRYHQQHIDLMDSMSMFNRQNFQKLDDIAAFLDLPFRDKMAVSVEVNSEQAVIKTWLIYIRWMLLKGQLTQSDHAKAIQNMIVCLKEQHQHHEFLTHWQAVAKHTALSRTFFS
ncbi:3'-5' exonuclease [Acinetobacter sp. B5B]|uniref:ribonuclease H-like domain-containing protein n=1 Tax=Acinetobacter baretiae TaxID=2605383 RepID=UPI0018C2A246|nr:ribonuclease H-like domain-containing protein [Acinetobacter baretiae]MBF7683603.1 3'-5' exonuclease [Acinetobacter baretiae]MBF7686042.1 3'-5' exonuclease [Acinetobacter baretiae]